LEPIFSVCTGNGSNHGVNQTNSAYDSHATVNVRRP
jgi:hypothetical protein